MAVPTPGRAKQDGQSGGAAMMNGWDAMLAIIINVPLGGLVSAEQDGYIRPDDAAGIFEALKRFRQPQTALVTH